MADLVNLTIDGRAVQAPPGTLVIDAAKTVGELRNMTSWPENAVVTIPQQRDPESIVKVSKASVVTHYPPRR